MDAGSVETQTFGISAGDIAAIDRWIATAIGRWDLPERVVFGARLCVAELAANALEHGGSPRGSDRITLTIRRAGDGIAIEFVDARAAFDPTRVAPAASPHAGVMKPPGGLGLKLVRAYADELSYRDDGVHNRVTLTIRSAAAQARRTA